MQKGPLNGYTPNILELDSQSPGFGEFETNLLHSAAQNTKYPKSWQTMRKHSHGTDGWIIWTWYDVWKLMGQTSWFQKRPHFPWNNGRFLCFVGCFFHIWRDLKVNSFETHVDCGPAGNDAHYLRVALVFQLENLCYCPSCRTLGPYMRFHVGAYDFAGVPLKNEKFGDSSVCMDSPACKGRWCSQSGGSGRRVCCSDAFPSQWMSE